MMICSKGELRPTDGFGYHGTDDSVGLVSDAIVFEPGAPAKDANGGVC